MRLGHLILLSWRTAVTRRVASALITIVVAATCVLTLLTVGRSAAQMTALADSLNEPRSRLLTLRSQGEADFITPAAVTQVRGLSQVQVGVGLSFPVDVRNGRLPGVAAVPLWRVTHELDVARIVSGRAPNEGEAIIAEDAAVGQSIDLPVGYVEDAAGGQYPIVGIFAPLPGFEFLSAGLVTPAQDGDLLSSLSLLVERVDLTAPTLATVVSILGSPSPDKLAIQNPPGLGVAGELLRRSLGSYHYTALLISLAAGGVFTIAVVVSDVLANRRDLGRRRALGMTRADLVLFTVLRTVWPAAVGGVLAAAATSGYFLYTGAPLVWQQTLALLITLLTSTVGSALLPAIWASRIDPVKVLRSP